MSGVGIVQVVAYVAVAVVVVGMPVVFQRMGATPPAWAETLVVTR